MRIRLAVSIQYRPTDGQTPHYNICIASRGKKRLILHQLTCSWSSRRSSNKNTSSFDTTAQTHIQYNEYCQL